SPVVENEASVSSSTSLISTRARGVHCRAAPVPKNHHRWQTSSHISWLWPHSTANHICQYIWTVRRIELSDPKRRMEFDLDLTILPLPGSHFRLETQHVVVSHRKTDFLRNIRRPRYWIIDDVVPPTRIYRKNVEQGRHRGARRRA